MSLVTFMFGNHTFKCFDDKEKALAFNSDLWDEEDQSSLLRLELVEVEGIDVILREGGSISYFSERIERAISSLPNVRDHRAGPGDQVQAEKAIVAGSGASTCWAAVQSGDAI